jgi:glucokinase
VLNAPVRVLNDFEAAGYGVLALPDPASPAAAGITVTLNAGARDPAAPIAVLGPGTGLGEAQLFFCPATGGHRVWPSEGSHGGFAPRGGAQRALAAAVEAELGFCEVEAVACGAGLARIDAFLAAQAGLPARTRAPADVTAAALGGGDPVAADALNMLLSILGAEAAAMALRSLARGGVYLAGGITPKIAPAFVGKPAGANPLLDAFLWKEHSKFAPLLATIPFIAVLDDGLGLRGAGLCARRLLEDGGAARRGDGVGAFLF